MIVYEDSNRVGLEAAQEAFDKLVSAAAPASPIERAAYLYGMQTFCRHQLKQELSVALNALDSSSLNDPKLCDLVDMQ